MNIERSGSRQSSHASGQDLSLALANSRIEAAVAVEALQQSERLRNDAAERESALEHELQHRVRNMLATIRAVFTRTIDTARTLEEAADHFTGRLDTIARYQGIMARYPHGAVDLEMLVRDELLSLGFGSGDHVIAQGPPVELRLDAAAPLAIAVHELVMNAMKFGALSENGGKLAVIWSVDSLDEALLIEWTETGVPVVTSAPMRVGFGREYIESALPYQLDAETHFELRPGGLTCRIILARKNLKR